MSREVDGSDIAYMAAFLRLRKALGQKTVLVLGARTGGLFRSEELYRTLEQYDPSSFADKRLEQFGRCYQLLTGELASQGQRESDSLPPLFPKFGPLEIDNILSLALSKIDIATADIYLAELVQQGLFDTIISTNVDDILEQALKHRGMKDAQDFHVFDPSMDIETLNNTHQFPCPIMKVFGQFVTNRYTLERSEYLTRHPHLVNWLQGVMRQHLLVIGLDPIWDAEIFRALPTKGKSLWYVNEESFEGQLEIDRMGKEGPAWYILEEEGSYDYFIKTLHSECSSASWNTLLTEIKLHELRTLTAQAADKTFSQDMEQQQDSAAKQVKSQVTARRPLEVFVSSVPNDELHRIALSHHLASLRKENLISMWHESDMTGGTDKKYEMSHHLDSAAIILLLISARFIASDEIEAEVKRAMERHETGSARVIPIILSPCEWRKRPFGRLVPLPRNSRPVTRWKNRDEAYVEVEQGLRKVIEELKK